MVTKCRTFIVKQRYFYNTDKARKGRNHRAVHRHDDHPHHEHQYRKGGHSIFGVAGEKGQKDGVEGEGSGGSSLTAVESESDSEGEGEDGWETAEDEKLIEVMVVVEKGWEEVTSEAVSEEQAEDGAVAIEVVPGEENGWEEIPSAVLEEQVKMVEAAVKHVTWDSEGEGRAKNLMKKPAVAELVGEDKLSEAEKSIVGGENLKNNDVKGEDKLSAAYAAVVR